MLKAGTLQDFNNSMAEAIEKEFEDLWQARYSVGLPAETRKDRQLLFVAIAQGVIKHLREHAADAIKVEVTVQQTQGNLIGSEGSTVAAGGIHSHDVAVTQSPHGDPPTNVVESAGEGIVRILVEGLDP